ncbi:MAG: hypothetical protein H6565_01070 [Lewinellaceae bacterium]|nr:hypothetical protein [Saprospiraceae bacterium]MCB9305163.1 hypothetical protein [Lewinellaceae bacterium]MCB9355574.1 hypothetical protein [Lewinellaceae bacterium]
MRRILISNKVSDMFTFNAVPQSTNAISRLANIMFPAALLAAVLAGCGGDDAKHPDISGIDVQVQVQRFDRDLFALDTADLKTGMQQLTQKYPEMFPLFAVNIIHDQTNPDETPEQAVRGFLSAPQIRHLYDTVRQVYGDLRWLDRDLTKMFRYYKYYFPERPVPTVVTMVSEFVTDAFTAGDSLCGIGLDMFLGENYPAYFADPNTEPYYIRRQFVKPYMTIRLAKTIAQNIAGPPPGNRLLDQMIHNGKMLYIVDHLLPEVPDSMKMGYTREQMEGCYANEQNVWARMLEQNLLYSTDAQKLRKLVSPSPNAPVVFQEAPGEIGNWIGWRIVEAYMERFPETTMQALLEQNDAQQFLEQAKYKPRRN